MFFVPGIVKSIAYSQMFFILDEHPDIGVRKAMRVSKEITKGYKGELFLMGLSFLGWENSELPYNGNSEPLAASLRVNVLYKRIPRFNVTRNKVR